MSLGQFIAGLLLWGAIAGVLSVLGVAALGHMAAWLAGAEWTAGGREAFAVVNAFTALCGAVVAMAAYCGIFAGHVE